MYGTYTEVLNMLVHDMNENENTVKVNVVLSFEIYEHFNVWFNCVFFKFVTEYQSVPISCKYIFYTSNWSICL